MSGATDTCSAPTTIAAGPLERALRLGPDDPFPDELRELPVGDLQVLHSRICRQLDVEYLSDPGGRHPITLDRLQELELEFDSRLLR